MKGVFQVVLWSLFATASVLLVTGLILPNHYRVERSILIDAPAARVHPWVEDLQRWPTWATWNRRDPSLVVQYSGPPRGAGARETWRSEKSGSGTVTVTRSEPQAGVWFVSDLGDGTRGDGSITYREAAGTTTVTWISQGQLPRLVGGFFRSHFEEVLAAHCDEGLKRLKHAVESENPTP